MLDAQHIVAQLQQAGSPQEIAGYLLRAADAIVLSHGLQLQAECLRHRFAAGAAFLELRAAGLNAGRDAHGLIPTGIALETELWRHTLSRFAAGQRQGLPDFMRGRDEQPGKG